MASEIGIYKNREGNIKDFALLTREITWSNKKSLCPVKPQKKEPLYKNEYTRKMV